MLSVAKHIASNGWMMINLLWLIPLRYVHRETNTYLSNTAKFWIFDPRIWDRQVVLKRR